MGKTKYVKGKDGKFKGSIGEGKTNVPTSSQQRNEKWNVDDSDMFEGISPIEKANREYGRKLAYYTSLTDDEDLLRSRWQSRHQQVRRAVGDNNNVPADLQLQMIKDNDDKTRFPEGNENFGAYWSLADNPNATPEALDAMAHMDFPSVTEVHRRIARNPNTSRATLEYLLDKPEPMFGMGVGTSENPNLTEDLLEKMTHHPSEYTSRFAREELKRRPKWNTKEATMCMPPRQEAGSSVRRSLAELENFPESTDVLVQVPKIPATAKNMARHGTRRDALITLHYAVMGKHSWPQETRNAIYECALENPNIPKDVKESVEKYWLDRWEK